MKQAEAYEPFYQFLKEPSDSEKWKALRRLVDNLVAETERDTIDRVLEIIDLETSDPSSGEDGDEPMSYAAGWMACGFLIKDKVLVLKEGEQE